MDMQELATKPMDESKSRIKPILTTFRFFESKAVLVLFLAETRMRLLVVIMSRRWRYNLENLITAQLFGVLAGACEIIMYMQGRYLNLKKNRYIWVIILKY